MPLLEAILLQNESIRKAAMDLLQSKDLTIINPTKTSGFFKSKSKKVTVVTPTYNSEDFIDKTIKSVMNQTIGFDNIQFIIIDDCSTDSTPSIIKTYAKKHKNICAVLLNKNTGSPGTPRNIGIELAISNYITFLDGDDWLAPDGLEHLYNIMEETDDDYVVGKTVKAQSAGESIIGEWASIKERRSISPFDVPHFFYHMGPTARMMRLSVIRENDIGFPEMKFGEDRYFFFKYLLCSKSVSTTTRPIYYANRLEENTSSLTRITNVLDKRRCDLFIIDFVRSQNLPIEKEQVLLTRIYEYDFIRTLDSQTFLNAKNKQEFFDVLEDAFNLIKDLSYDITDSFFKPIYKTAAKLFLEGKNEKLIQLLRWYKRDQNKRFLIKDNIAFMEAPFLEDDKYNLIEVPMFSRYLNSYVMNNKYILQFEIYGSKLSQINEVVIRDRSKIDNDLLYKIKLDGNIGTIEIELSDLEKVSNSLYSIFVRYCEYELVNIRQISKNNIDYHDKKFEFYSTKSNYLGLAIKAK